MSRIEQALRRAGMSALDDLAPAQDEEASLGPDLVLRQEPVSPAAGDSIELAEALFAAPALTVSSEPAEPELRAPDLPSVGEQTPLPDTLREPVGRTGARSERRSEKLILNQEIPQAVLEQYRRVGASLHQLQVDRGIKIVMIASALAEEGKTITASNIALTLSESFKRRVLLIDADLRRPSIHRVFGTPNTSGLSDALQADRDEKLTIFEVTPHLSVLPSGRPNPDPMSSLSSERMRTIVAEAGTKFDWVVIDTPPVGVLADARLLAEMVDVVVLVIGAGRTPYRAIERAVAAIDRKRIAGVVLNRVTEQPVGYHDYDYYLSAAHGG
jgi:protein-tyrosine kinase